MTHPTWRLTLLLTAVLVSVLPRQGGCSFQLTIMHTNDVHDRYDETDKYSAKCVDPGPALGLCFGGTARLYSKITEIRRAWNNTVLLDAGDQYQGTVWFYTYGGNVTAHFTNTLKYDVMALGNHEFDRGVDGLRVLLRLAAYPIISSNLNASLYSDVRGKVLPYLILNVSNERIGVVGYTSVDTPSVSNTENITFNDEVASVTSHVAHLTSLGVTKIVCLGHSGYVTDLSIAQIPGVDVVVGGHTHSFLYNGTAPSIERPEADYPTVVTRPNGTKALVVQAYAFGKYLGFLQVTFDDKGEVESWSGNPILLNSSVSQDPVVLADVIAWRQEVDSRTKRTIGSTLVFLEGSTDCRLRECNMGNVITDAMMAQNLRHSAGSDWNHVAIAINNGGGIRTPVPKGDVTAADVLTVQPFRNTVDIVQLNGSALLQVLEHSASHWNPVTKPGGFLQLSGLKVTYDMSNPGGQRVVRLKVRCADCPVPRFVDLEPAKVYKVILPSFLANGGDGYTVIVQNTLKRYIIGDLDSDVLMEYITKFSPITTGIEDRITFVNSSQTTTFVNSTPTTTFAKSSPTTTFVNSSQTTEGEITKCKTSGSNVNLVMPIQPLSYLLISLAFSVCWYEFL